MYNIMKAPKIGVYTAMLVVIALLSLFFATCEEVTQDSPPGDSPPGGPSLAGVTLTVSAQQLGNVLITWTDPDYADFSHILITWEPIGGIVTQPFRVDKGVETATIAQLADGVNYTFTAVSVDTAGNQSPASPPAEVTANSVAPFIVRDLTAALQANGAVELTWIDPSDPDGDLSHIRVQWTPEHGIDQPLTINPGTQAATVTGLMDGVEYTFTTASVDTVGHTSSRFVRATADAAAPAVVTNINTTVTSSAISLTWTDPTASDLSHIELTWSPADGSQAQPLRVAAGVQAAQLIGLNASTPYAVTITSSDTIGNETATTTMVTTPAVNLTAVTAASATTIAADGTTTISWTDPTATSNIAKISITGTPAPTTAVEVMLGVGTANITGLTAPGSAHTFTITTLDSADATLGTTLISATAATARPVALFRLGGTDTHDGDFGFAACNTELTTDMGAVATALRNAGYTEAVFFGSKSNDPGYIFRDLATDTNALDLNGADDTDLEARQVVVYPPGYTSGDPTSTFGSPLVTHTIGNLSVPAGVLGAWQNNAYDVVDDLTTGSFWAFSNVGGDSATLDCDDASSTVFNVAGLIGSSLGLRNSETCDMSLPVICAAH